MQEQQQIYDDEITLKELILKTQEFWQEILKHWKLVIFIFIPFVVLFLFRAVTIPVTYSARLTFMLNEGNGGGGVSALLGQFGFGGGSKGGVNVNKMIELSKSRKIISMILFEEIVVNEQKDYIANHIIREYDFHKKWKKSEKLKDFYFTHHSIDSFSIVENSALISLYSYIINEKERIYSLTSNEKSGILTLIFSTKVDELSYECSNRLFEKLSTYYVDEAISKQRETYDILKQKTDSLEQALNSKQLQLLRFQDSNRGLSLKQYEATQLRLQGDVQKLLATYTENYKNLQIQDFTIKTQTPLITTLDTPIYPISQNSESKIKAIVLGGFLGGFLAILFVVSRKIFRDTMNN